ncbi:hypothetical protein [Neobacillus niacini]|uniref:hypothetical protein n=1 Tax=Neobacillus niacini TaxID=86668 RepID=UPI0021CB28EC|nr:hypothetical protein [Neobacillus niacini]MCM3768370.1 hypothetical protein [Neobacillus niacini]
MAEDYRKYSDWQLENEYERTGKYAVEREMDRRGLLDEDEDEEYEEEIQREKESDSKGSIFSGIIGLLIIATIIGLFIEPKGTIKIVKTIFMFIAYGILKLIELIFY